MQVHRMYVQHAHLEHCSNILCLHVKQTQDGNGESARSLGALVLRVWPARLPADGRAEKSHRGPMLESLEVKLAFK
jgi:hypothetical protein